MSSNTNYKGPTSSQKKRKGGKYRGGNKSVNIHEFDTESCNVGVVEGIVNGNSINVKDLKTNKMVHCTTHRVNTRRCPRGSLIVFSYIYGNNTGEMINMFNTDDLVELCEHFGVGQEKASKAIGIGVGFGNGEFEQDEYIPIAKTSSILSNDKISNQSLHSMDLISENDLENSEESIDYEEKEIKYDRFGNTIEDKPIEVVLDLVQENSCDTINVISEDYDQTEDVDNIENGEENANESTSNVNKFRKNKKNLKNARAFARNKKNNFIEY